MSQRARQVADLLTWGEHTLAMHVAYGPGTTFELAPAVVGDLAGKVWRWREEALGLGLAPFCSECFEPWGSCDHENERARSRRVVP